MIGLNIMAEVLQYLWLLARGFFYLVLTTFQTSYPSTVGNERSGIPTYCLCDSIDIFFHH